MVTLKGREIMERFVFEFGRLLGALRNPEYRKYFYRRGVTEKQLEEFEITAAVLAKAFYGRAADKGKFYCFADDDSMPVSKEYIDNTLGRS